MVTFTCTFLLNAQETLPKGFIMGKLIDELNDEPIHDANIRILTNLENGIVN